VPGATCCNSFWLIGERIRTVTLNGILACMDPSCADRKFRSWSTIGRVLDPLGESLVVSFQRASLTTGSRNVNQATRPIVITRAEYRVELRENGWPTQKVDRSTESILAPDWKMQHALTVHALSHAEKMWRTLVNAAATTVQTASLFPQASNPHIRPRGVVVDPLEPLPPHGDQIGFGFIVRVDTDLNPPQPSTGP